MIFLHIDDAQIHKFQEKLNKVIPSQVNEAAAQQLESPKKPEEVPVE